ncbi:serine hydrolase [Meiothermus sp.]|uniref:serine hydrolase n=1 Tax=Meiothermus sp. TaxID=1955249 RepID=UPI0021DE98ED|nr:serine hydrolase [Meiothermus sp.]GIW24186.1 MAG: serine hydrolase [Meiothermus sp.]
MNRIRWMMVLLFGLLIAVAQTPLTPKMALERLFTERPAKAEWFAPVFLQQVSVVQVEAILQQLLNGLGAYQSVEPDGPNFRVNFERGVVPAQISLDAQGRIQGLFFRPAQPRTTLTLEQLLAEYRTLPGQVSVLVLEGSQERLNLNADAVLAVGSAFKLAVLEALRQQIEAGQRRWSDTVPLRPEWKSLPSGTLQNLPDGTPLSLEQYATQMISISDNTATDALIAIVGRSEVEKLSPRNRPFLTTREAFVLKNPQNREWLLRYRANPAERTALLPALAQLPLPDASVFAGEPVAIDVEWFFSTRELCALMGRVQALPLMSLNPGLANPTDWQRVAYKGGSEPGVLNLTTWLTARDGKQYCVSATWNNPQARLDENRFFLLYTSLLSTLK